MVQQSEFTVGGETWSLLRLDPVTPTVVKSGSGADATKGSSSNSSGSGPKALATRGSANNSSSSSMHNAVVVAHSGGKAMTNKSGIPATKSKQIEPGWCKFPSLITLAFLRLFGFVLFLLILLSSSA